MQKSGDTFQLSASDLVGHLDCRHLTALDRAVAEGALAKPKVWDPLLKILSERGSAHELAYIEHLQAAGIGVVRIDGVEVTDAAAAETLAAMKAGAPIIVQAALSASGWIGRADILRRIDTHPSALGSWSYEVIDTKLARETKAGAVLQLCLYSDLLGQAQGAEPEYMYVVAPWSDFIPQRFRYADCAAYFRKVKLGLSQAIALADGGDVYPDPREHCEICRWCENCDKRRRDDDHLCLVAGISKIQMGELKSHDVSSTGDGMPAVDALVYSSGKSKPQQEKAKRFLTDLGVRELGEAEEVELILKARYTLEAEVPDDKTYWRDFQRFVALVTEQPEKARLFAKYYIFLGDDDQWHTPNGIYLDQPYKPTDLSTYYGKLGDDAACVALHISYQASGVNLEQIGAFAHAVGARLDLEIKSRDCRTNPQWNYLRSVGGDRYTSPIDRDYYIPGLVELLKAPNLDLSRLIWRTLTTLPSHPHYLQATYQRNQSWGAHYADSLLVNELRDAAWVPRADGKFVRPAEASRGDLPEGFPFDSGSRGLKAIQFGSEVERQSAKKREKDDVAKTAGFADANALERAKRFAAVPEEEQERFFVEREAAAKSAIPDRDPANPERRARTVAEKAQNAPDKESEIRSRCMSIGREEVKAEAEQYLRQHYRNSEGEMTCQICKGPLPFKLDDGSEFFEVVEFLPGLRKRHHQNYLALCPNHSAMYRHANGCKEIICDLVESLTGNELEVILAQRNMTIYLSTIHVLDIKAVRAVEAVLLTESDGIE